MEKGYRKIASHSPDNTVWMDDGTRVKRLGKEMNDFKDYSGQEAVKSCDLPCHKGTQYRKGQQQSQ